MRTIRFELSPDELKALAMMAENELMRMRFVDPRMPGHMANPAVLRAAQSITTRLLDASKKQRVFTTSSHGQVEVRAARRISLG